MNPLLTTQTETFRSGEDNLSFYHGRQVKMINGALMFCSSGEADITIDLEKYHIIPNTNIIILPGSVLSLTSASKNFTVHYFAYSDEMMRLASFRLEPAFIGRLKEISCYTHTNPGVIEAILALIKFGTSVYADKENRFKNNIAQNLLQIFFLNTYDKMQRFFPQHELGGSTRKGQLFKKFIWEVRAHCAKQRDVSFYAEHLCISTRYLSAICQEIAKCPAKEIIDKFLILEIKLTLQTTNLSLKEVAEYYRFPDQSFFGRYFKKHTGISPKEYRATQI
ncbi:AraC family transcriptional regulator [Bacteroides sp. 51]|nr:AraC family transcriptional regulator [Bacteroides sp. 51]